MAVVRLGPNGEVEVLDPGPPEKAEQTEAALMHFVEALARADAARDYAKAVADRRASQATTGKSPTDP